MALLFLFICILDKFVYNKDEEKKKKFFEAHFFVHKEEYNDEGL